MSFNVGEEVICVNNKPGDWLHGLCDLIKGKTYIVLDKCPNECCIHVGGPLFWEQSRFRRPSVDESTIETKVTERV